MFYPERLQKTASPQIKQMGQQMARFFKELSQPTSVNNAVRPQILKNMNQPMGSIQQATQKTQQAAKGISNAVS